MSKPKEPLPSEVKDADGVDVVEEDPVPPFVEIDGQEFRPMTDAELREFSEECRPIFAMVHAMGDFKEREENVDLERAFILDHPVHAHFRRLIAQLEKNEEVGMRGRLIILTEMIADYALGALPKNQKRQVVLRALEQGVDRDHVRRWAKYGDDTSSRRAFNAFVRDAKKDIEDEK